jgi:uncharacterized protein
MATLTFETLRFSEREGSLHIVFLKYFVCEIDRALVEKIGKYTIKGNTITFPDLTEQRAQRKFIFLLQKAFGNLRSLMTNKPTTYIHQNSGIPLIGSRYIGIQDRGTNFLEVKPITGCNMGCVFCSVDEGIGSKKAHDFVVEREYLVTETQKLLTYKQYENVHIYINVHGEPLLYADIVGLIADLKQITWVKDITIITTAVLLTKEMVDDLVRAGLTEFNVSISAMDVNEAKIIMNAKSYDIEKVKDIVRYAASKVKTTIAPVWVDGMNDKEMEPIIAFGNEIDVPIRIQKFCHNKFGRNAAEELSWDEFYSKIKKLEEKTGVSLREAEDSYKLIETKELDKPFKKGDIIEAKIVSVGRYNHERLCVAEDRIISVPKCKKDKGSVKIKILRSVHNVYVGECL